ncbi:4'-phosphopantetheinyl transferase family protein [Flavobacterium urocaniciphilum]|uniref:Phosphopantetheinyl transferase n=1 Tax=Flavobacterium urocaniciphilum TaxID=1299341 RepID=A0A1H9CF02_9FLAO|nr:4'-phosphopantetheinyl transferase superfamily protein [Flavobacterium urocaniciphilum]SEP99724.1 Phosphopantetheinyl transferase [Flavobacterium urocaniciphilum]
MPFYKEIKINSTTTAYFWKISEDTEWLYENIQLNENSLSRLENMNSEEHKRGFLAVRMLLQHIGYTDFNLVYDTFGKPHLIKDIQKKSEYSSKQISISHSHEFSCICISNQNIGIDLEKRKEKTLKIAPRFMDICHLENLSEEDKIAKATVIWGVKESVFKLKNEKGISFPNHISEAPFQLMDKKGTTYLNFNETTQNFQFHFEFVDDYIFVCVLSCNTE